MNFADLKVGDIVDRQMGANGSIMKMIVVNITDSLIYCDADGDRPMQGQPMEAHWTFDRETGVEEDEYLGWGKKFGVTGTRLVKVQ